MRGGALKKIAPSGRKRENFGVFRVKNHDFTPKKSYFFQFLGGRAPGAPPLNPPLIHVCRKLNLHTKKTKRRKWLYVFIYSDRNGSDCILKHFILLCHLRLFQFICKLKYMIMSINLFVTDDNLGARD